MALEIPELAEKKIATVLDIFGIATGRLEAHRARTVDYKVPFPDDFGLIDTDGRLFTPMRNVQDYKCIKSVQCISDAGERITVATGLLRAMPSTVGMDANDYHQC